MKKKSLLFCLCASLALCACGGGEEPGVDPNPEPVEDNSPILEFEDPALEACLLATQSVEWNGQTYVIQVDKNGDGKISQMEAEAVKVLALSDIQYYLSEDIYSLDGLEYFKNLEYLDFSYRIYGLGCTIDVSPFRSLKHLRLWGEIGSLDVSRNTELEYLECSSCRLTTLDVTHNPALEVLLCNDNGMATLDVSQNAALKELVCSNNPLIVLGINQNKALKRLECDGCKLSFLDVTGNPALETLWCHSNALSSLDVSQNASLSYLNCNSNAEITSLDVSHNPALSVLECAGCRLSTVDVSGNAQLRELVCGNTSELTALDVSHNPQLRILWCDNSPISRLELSRNPELVNLSCYGTLIEHLDLGIHKKLQRFCPVNWNDYSPDGLYINPSLACPLKTLVLSREAQLVEHNMEVLAKVYPDLVITYAD